VKSKVVLRTVFLMLVMTISFFMIPSVNAGENLHFFILLMNRFD
jgi:hypothetical protein